MKIERTFNVEPSIPKELKDLEIIGNNIWFSWHPDAINLFHRLDPDLWEKVSHNPVAMLGSLDQSIFDERKTDEGYLMQLERVKNDFDRYTGFKTSYNFNIDEPIDFSIAYFSAEFGLSDCLPIYSGGLGILSGDHLKSASDLRVPLTGVGLLYQQGYFRQYLNADGWQQETYPENDFSALPVKLLRDEKGDPLYNMVKILSRDVFFKIWKVEVGRISLYLLDTNTHRNSAADREITSQLYGGDSEMRIKQEILLGIGGTRALDMLDIHPSVYHMNEGHSAFAVLERINLAMKKFGLNFNEAKEMVIYSNVFTTHTPVPAGVDRFETELVVRYFQDYVQEIGISIEDLLSYGRINPSNKKEPFCMLAIAMKFSAFRNAVSKLHTQISKNMWAEIWPRFPREDTPIDGVTNGIHIPSWISTDMGSLYDRYLGRRWMEDPDNERVWDRINSIPDSEIWRTHERRRERLVGFARRRLLQQLKKRGASNSYIEKSVEALNPEALTIGFARRFATYKRGNLIFKDPERIARILQNHDRPVQIIFSGKAHPRDNEGKKIIKDIIHFLKEEPFRSHVVFIEDYDINVARYMVQGVDLWLNTPRRPEEACGTSGMKATANGAINMSILDGWWDEAYNFDNGWAIGKGEEYTDLELQDEVESRAIYTLLEEEVVPLFYRKGADNIPKDWVKLMKKSLISLCKYFNTHRMVEDYLLKYYYPAAKHYDVFLKNPEANKEIADWKDFIKRGWNSIRLQKMNTSQNGNSIEINNPYTVEARIDLGDIKPEDLQVDIYYGKLNHRAELITRDVCPMELQKKMEGSIYSYKGLVCPKKTGKFGYLIRILPKHPLLFDIYSLNLVHWF